MRRPSISHPIGRKAFVLAGLAVLASLGWFTYRAFFDVWRPSRVFAGSADDTPIAFSPDGKTLVMRRSDEGLSAWNVATGQRGREWSKNGPIHGLASAFSPDGKTFAVTVGGANVDLGSTLNNQVELIDAATGVPRLTLETNRSFVYRLNWSADGSSLHAAIGSTDKFDELITWDAATGRRISAWPSSFGTKAISAGISPDGKTMAAARKGPGLDLLDLERDRVVGRLDSPSNFDDHPNGIAYSADGGTMIVGRDDGAVGVWDLPGRKLLKTIPVFPQSWWVYWVEISPDGRTFAAYTYTKPDDSPLIKVRDTLGWKLFGRPGSSGQPLVVVVDMASGQILGRIENASSPVYSPDGRTIAVRDEDRGVVLYDVPPSP